MSEAAEPNPTAPNALGAALLPRRFQSHRTVWHTAGLLLALAIAWLVFHAYLQPDFLIDFVNLRLC
ncbi:MAG: hypothetical protein H0T80_14310 [Betaproteobacteria bacterium]|nr:hypothetical protein [Betaproteobacteria bacterium]MBA3775952.1 hypothetical protein [Betaproteobacteria bacterium]